MISATNHGNRRDTAFLYLLNEESVRGERSVVAIGICDNVWNSAAA